MYYSSTSALTRVATARIALRRSTVASRRNVTSPTITAEDKNLIPIR